MNNILEYKGYHTKVEFDSHDLVLRGKIEGINDLVNFECENINDVKNAFEEAVDDYLEFCKEVGKEPEKEYKGTFNIRIEPELHKKIAVLASKRGETLNSTVQRAIAEYVLSESTKDRVLRTTIKILAEAMKTETKYEYEKPAKKAEGNILMFPNVKMEYREEMVN
ncbi:MAG: type II toxin-antitoxin system HicB family antitoxin [Lachnospiraceae bacterium]|nr:type II toxin-antitoxin system HicB family antitoxin [Lachnospiraceae bacterium]